MAVGQHREQRLKSYMRGCRWPAFFKGFPNGAAQTGGIGLIPDL